MILYQKKTKVFVLAILVLNSQHCLSSAEKADGKSFIGYCGEHIRNHPVLVLTGAVICAVAGGIVIARRPLEKFFRKRDAVRPEKQFGRVSDDGEVVHDCPVGPASVEQPVCSAKEIDPLEGTALGQAIASRDIETVRQIITQEDPAKRTDLALLLGMAVRNGNKERVENLFYVGADPDKQYTLAGKTSTAFDDAIRLPDADDRRNTLVLMMRLQGPTRYLRTNV